MKTLLLSNGDLVVAADGHATLTGSSRIRQDLALALGEDYGFDKYHPEWGSVINRYIGQPIDDETAMMVRGEVLRVLNGYIQQQNFALQEDTLRNRISRFALSDVVSRVVNIDVDLDLDYIRVIVLLETLNREQFTIARTVNI